MGRPIRKVWFGPAATAGSQIIVSGVKFANGDTATGAYIVKQTGDRKYIVSNGVKSEQVFLVNALDVANLQPGQCFIIATPFGGVPSACEKIAQYKLSVYQADGRIVSYTWSTQPATKLGQCDLITLSELGFPINTAVPVISGTPAVGQVLSVSTGTWTSGSPVTYSYMWMENGADSGITTSSLTLDGDWEGNTVSVRVTATNANGSNSVTTATVGPVTA